MLKAVKCNTLEEVVSIYKEYDVIAIDEGQFFSDVTI
jgi:Thymidine kinase.